MLNSGVINVGIAVITRTDIVRIICSTKNLFRSGYFKNLVQKTLPDAYGYYATDLFKNEKSIYIVDVLRVLCDSDYSFLGNDTSTKTYAVEDDDIEKRYKHILNTRDRDPLDRIVLFAQLYYVDKIVNVLKILTKLDLDNDLMDNTVSLIFKNVMDMLPSDLLLTFCNDLLSSHDIALKYKVGFASLDISFENLANSYKIYVESYYSTKTYFIANDNMYAAFIPPSQKIIKIGPIHINMEYDIDKNINFSIVVNIPKESGFTKYIRPFKEKEMIDDSTNIITSNLYIIFYTGIGQSRAQMLTALSTSSWIYESLNINGGVDKNFAHVVKLKSPRLENNIPGEIIREQIVINLKPLLDYFLIGI